MGFWTLLSVLLESSNEWTSNEPPKKRTFTFFHRIICISHALQVIKLRFRQIWSNNNLFQRISIDSNILKLLGWLKHIISGCRLSKRNESKELWFGLVTVVVRPVVVWPVVVRPCFTAFIPSRPIPIASKRQATSFRSCCSSETCSSTFETASPETTTFETMNCAGQSCLMKDFIQFNLWESLKIQS